MITLMITIAMIQTTCASPISRRVINITGVPDTGYDSIGIAYAFLSLIVRPLTWSLSGPKKHSLWEATAMKRPRRLTAPLPKKFFQVVRAQGSRRHMCMRLKRSRFWLLMVSECLKRRCTVYYGVESTFTPNISYVSSSCASTCNLSANNAILSATLSSILTVLLIAIYKWLRCYLSRHFERAKNDSEACGRKVASPSPAYSDPSGVAVPEKHSRLYS
ncbi:hypothetical protein F5146DRAFT_1066791 [Armillaria mellea]|nr:hypothetical protein F5146DRAFT_1066791 [Armillaria mellea]